MVLFKSLIIVCISCFSFADDLSVRLTAVIEKQLELTRLQANQISEKIDRLRADSRGTETIGGSLVHKELDELVLVQRGLSQQISQLELKRDLLIRR